MEDGIKLQREKKEEWKIWGRIPEGNRKLKKTGKDPKRCLQSKINGFV